MIPVRRDGERESSALELGWHELELELAAPTQDAHGHARADPLADHQALDVEHSRDGDAVELDDQVLGAQPRRGRGRSLDHLHDFHASLPSEPARKAWWKRPRSSGDPE